MAENKGMKWITGVSGVLAFTGFLYLTQKANSADPDVWVKKHNPDRNAYGEKSELNGSLPDSDAEMFRFEAEKLEQIPGRAYDRKSNREKLLDELDWDDDPDKEITIPPQAKRNGQKSTGSNLKTRRS
jgi:hypothetical protein